VARLERLPRGGVRLRWANAGHPPPLLLHPDGALDVLGDLMGDLMLGVDATARRRESAVCLGEGCTIVLYTDGLVERRGSTLDAVGVPSDPGDASAERLVLAFDELASNALRHGESPVVATVIAGSGGWLLDVSDRAPETMPIPAVGRDPAQGGLGLYLVARFS